MAVDSRITIDEERIAPESSTKSHFRADIQGLRALAVLLVFADHLSGYPRGGFLGVDVFFVISGFLITRILLREHDRSGWISFLGFYKRRMRRILPAAVLVLCVTVIASTALFTSIRAHSIRVDALWALLFSANYRFAFVGTDYFGQTAAISPLQHYWSLSVEEQFYFVWPWLMLLLLVAVAKVGRRRATRSIVASAMGLIIVGSFIWALHQTAKDPAWAYFDTPARVWELGVGALLAIVAPLFTGWAHRTRTVVAWLGLVVIAVAVLTISGDVKFPAPLAAVPVVGAAMIIAAGISGEQLALQPLTNPVSRYIGDISYSLYLWHFPAIVLLAAVFPKDAPIQYGVATLAVAFGVSVLSYHLVEEPFRQHGLRATLPIRRRHGGRFAWGLPAATMGDHDRPRPQGKILGVTALSAVSVALAAYALVPPAAPLDFSSAAGSEATGKQGQPLKTPEAVLQREIIAALQTVAWPKLTPPLDNVSQDRAPQFATTTDCMYPPLGELNACTYGSGKKYALVVGDSIGIAWMPGLVKALGSGWTVRDIAYGSCSLVDAQVKLPDVPSTTKCNNDRSAVTALINRLHPDLVILTGQQGALEDFADGAQGAAAIQEWTNARSQAVKSISSPGRQIVLLLPPPGGLDPNACYTAVSTPRDCTSSISSSWYQYREGETAVAARTNARVVDSSPWFCADNYCPIFVNGMPVRVDQLHMTATYSGSLSEVLRRALLQPKTVERQNRS